jgi:hypothetical protein
VRDLDARNARRCVDRRTYHALFPTLRPTVART